MKFLYTSQEGQPLQSKLQGFTARCKEANSGLKTEREKHFRDTSRKSHRVIIRHIKKSHYLNDSLQISDSDDD